MKAILAKGLSKKYWFYEKEAGLAGSIKSLFRGRKVFVEAVREINLDVEIGEIVGFIGPNGAGKTTTLKMLSGILYPTNGQIEVMGFIPSRREKTFLKSITFVTGQRNRLFWDLPAEEYFNFCRVVYEIQDEVYKKSLRELVELAEIRDILKIPQRKLSFGQRKRCELVAALLHRPRVIFLDEPTNALDLINAKKVREFIKETGRKRKQTILITSHNMSDIEQICDRMIIINKGKIAFDGNIRDLGRRNGANKRVKVIFNGPWTVGQVEKLGKILERNGQELLLEVEPEKMTSVASYLFSNLPVQDINIAGPPLEKIIESIYQESTSE